ncbi:MAG: DoxX family membrane protein [Candidatus Nanohaloarchaea archaeon]
MAYETILILGRTLLGSLFLYKGIEHFLKTRKLEAEARTRKIPEPELAVYLTGILLLTAATGIILGIYPGISIILLTLFLLTTTPVFHDFWRTHGTERQNQRDQFIKNIALIGALLILLTADWSIGIGATLIL